MLFLHYNFYSVSFLILICSKKLMLITLSLFIYFLLNGDFENETKKIH